MSEPYLIAHKVRGEPVFDIAERMPCPECASSGCAECDDEGYWWICSTSGHRARPYWSEALSKIGYPEQIGDDSILSVPPSCPEGWPDHYSINDCPLRASKDEVAKGRSLLAQLGLAKPKATIVRRF